MREKLMRLECHFTWDLKKENYDLPFMEIRLLEIITTPHGTPEDNAKGRAHNHLAYVTFLQGRTEEALENLKMAEEENKHSPLKCIVTYGNFAWVYHHKKEDSKVQTYLRKLEEITQRQSTASAHVCRDVYGEKGASLLMVTSRRDKRAKTHYSLALRTEPGDKEWNTGYALALVVNEPISIKKLPGESPATRQLWKALRYDPDNAMLWAHLGVICKLNGRKSQANEYMEKAIRLAPQNVKIVVKVAKFLRLDQRADEAVDKLKETLRIAPNSSRLHYRMFRCYQQEAKPESPNYKELCSLCILHLEEVVRLNPAYFYPHLDLAMMYEDEGESRLRDIGNRPSLAIHEKQAVLRCQGDFLLKYKKSENEAMKCYEEAMKLETGSTEWYRCRGKLDAIRKTNAESA